MPDTPTGVTISAMPGEVAVDGTEIVPVLQAGVNKTMSVAQLTSYLRNLFTPLFAPVDTNPLLATLQAVYPVGSMYLNSTDNTNPATLFGFGTWASVVDVCIVGAGNSYNLGATGGEATHVLTVPEMPSHSHTEAVRMIRA